MEFLSARGGKHEVARDDVDDQFSFWQRWKTTRRGFFRKPPRRKEIIAEKSFSLKTAKKSYVFRHFLNSEKLIKICSEFLVKNATSPHFALVKLSLFSNSKC